MIGAIGHDALAEGALTLLRAAGVNLDRVQSADASTGCAAITVDPTGANAITVGSGANNAVRAQQTEDALLHPANTLVLQMEVPPAETTSLIARARAAGTRVILNLAPAAALPEAALRAVDVLVVNETEGAWLSRYLNCPATGQTTAAGLSDRLGGITVVLTLGSEGADIAAKDGVWHEPAMTIQAVDTTAAGDCFVGVLAHRLDRGDPLIPAIRHATHAAALCCTRQGSQGSIPTTTETNAFAAR